MKRNAYFSIFKVLQFFLLTLLLLSFLLTSGCIPISNLLFGPSGSIEVTTYPSGAKIFLNDKDTGHFTPYTIINLAKGTYEIMVVLGDISYTETVIVYSSKTTNAYIELMPRLYKIVAQPSYMNLKEGESRAIDSITAIYLNSDSKDIDPSACSYNSNSNHATVSSSGIVTGISDGPAMITVSYTDAEITKTTTVNIFVGVIQISPPVSNPIVYRAFCIGVGDYQNFPDAYGNIDLLSPPYDVDRMIDVFNHCKFGTDEVVFSTPVSLKDLNATKTAIISGIASTFSGADDNDISYFYFSGHGINYEGISYLSPTETMYTSPLSAYISTNELESALSVIPGRKVVILDSCHSGGFIGKGKGEITISKEELISFNDEIINVFSQAQSKGLLTTIQYKVLTSCHYYQTCLSLEDLINQENSFGVFTMAFCNGCGYNTYNHPYPADTNLDTKVSLQEAYLYVKSWIEELSLIYVDITQDVQVYPYNSDFTIVEH
jgi:hypothetical protein